MRLRSILTVAILLLSATVLPAADRVRVSGGGITPLHAIIWVAHHEGLFKKYGLEVEYLTMNSGTLGVQTLLSNESQFLFSTGALAVTADVQGADIAIIAGGFNLFAFKLVSRPEIKPFRISKENAFPSASSARRPISRCRRAWKNLPSIPNR